VIYDPDISHPAHLIYISICKELHLVCSNVCSFSEMMAAADIVIDNNEDLTIPLAFGHA